MCLLCDSLRTHCSFGFSELPTLTPLLLKNVQAKTNNGETIDKPKLKKILQNN